jgi:amino acid transporter
MGLQYWHDPGALNHGFKGFCSVLVLVSFTFGGTELVGLAAAETANPRKSLPAALKQVFWRIAIFYFLTLGLIGLLIPYNNPRLLDGISGVKGRSPSPFVLAIEIAGIEVLPSCMNAAILIAILSVGNSAVYGSTRSLAALANLGHAPKFLAYIDRKGRPLYALCVAVVFGLLGFLADSPQHDAIFDWLMAISGLSTTTTWLCICVCHIRFRRTWAFRGHTLDELPFRSQAGITGSYIGVALGACLLISQLWTAASPVNAHNKTSSSIAQNFLLTWIGAPILLIFFGVHKLYYRTSLVHIKAMDIDTGRQRYKLSVLLAQEQDDKQGWPVWKKVYRYLC